MVIFGVANLTILLVVMAVKRYAFTSLWCAYAAVGECDYSGVLLEEQAGSAVQVWGGFVGVRFRAG